MRRTEGKRLGSNAPRLITMPHSPYCEKARWALDYCGVAYREEPHLALFHRFYTRQAGGSSVPVLVTPTDTLCSSSAITLHAHRCNPTAGLLPAVLTYRKEALALEQEFDTVLGPHARRWAYSHLLGTDSVLEQLATAGVPKKEQVVAKPLLYLARPFIRRTFRIDAFSAMASLQMVQGVFAKVEQRLQDGPYLVGAAFSLADLTFAALAAPVLRPAQYGGLRLLDEALPASMRYERNRLRASNAGSFANRIYETYRNRA